VVTTIICVEEEKARGSLASAMVSKKVATIRQLKAGFMVDNKIVAAR
jgi:hypothetical protein